MLIRALCDYYDMLSHSPDGQVLPEGYSKVPICYLIALTEDGKIDEIIDKRKTIAEEKVGKTKIKKVPVEMIMPKRESKSAINSEFIEHRPEYIFGLSYDNKNKTLVANECKKHNFFMKTNLELIKGINSPLVNAFRCFIQSWDADNETDNELLSSIGKEYGKPGYAFCLSGQPECLLHEEPEIKSRWEKLYKEKKSDDKDSIKGQCAIIGRQERIARIHGKIKGIYGGLATGNVLVGFNNDSENSYGNEQSYNSNISELAMAKYTEALNYLLSSDSGHKIVIDEMTIVYWATSMNKQYENLFMHMLMGSSDEMDENQTEQMIGKMLEDSKAGLVAEKRLDETDNISSDVDFYILGLKANSSRISVKCLIRKKYADVLYNVAKFQSDLQISKEFRIIPLSRIKKELVSPKSSNEKVNPALMSSLFDAIFYRKAYPISLLETVVRRVKTDSGKEKLNDVRAGIIKACINRSLKKEELKVALDKDNHGQAYLCGRLFAVLEKLQQEASGNTLNRTIKDSYFASASAKPALVFPKLIRLSQNHLNKANYPVFYNKLLEEIIGELNGEFPDTFMLKDQGRFIVGYYQQYQSFFEKKDKTEGK